MEGARASPPTSMLTGFSTRPVRSSVGEKRDSTRVNHPPEGHHGQLHHAVRSTGMRGGARKPRAKHGGGNAQSPRRRQHRHPHARQGRGRRRRPKLRMPIPQHVAAAPSSSTTAASAPAAGHGVSPRAGASESGHDLVQRGQRLLRMLHEVSAAPHTVAQLAAVAQAGTEATSPGGRQAFDLMALESAVSPMSPHSPRHAFAPTAPAATSKGGGWGSRKGTNSAPSPRQVATTRSHQPTATATATATDGPGGGAPTSVQPHDAAGGARAVTTHGNFLLVHPQRPGSRDSMRVAAPTPPVTSGGAAWRPSRPLSRKVAARSTELVDGDATTATAGATALATALAAAAASGSANTTTTTTVSAAYGRRTELQRPAQPSATQPLQHPTFNRPGVVAPGKASSRVRPPRSGEASNGCSRGDPPATNGHPGRAHHDRRRGSGISAGGAAAAPGSGAAPPGVDASLRAATLAAAGTTVTRVAIMPRERQPVVGGGGGGAALATGYLSQELTAAVFGHRPRAHSDRGGGGTTSTGNPKQHVRPRQRQRQRQRRGTAEAGPAKVAHRPASQRPTRVSPRQRHSTPSAATALAHGNGTFVAHGAGAVAVPGASTGLKHQQVRPPAHTNGKQRSRRSTLEVQPIATTHVSLSSAYGVLTTVKSPVEPATAAADTAAATQPVPERHGPQQWVTSIPATNDRPRPSTKPSHRTEGGAQAVVPRTTQQAVRRGNEGDSTLVSHADNGSGKRGKRGKGSEQGRDRVQPRKRKTSGFKTGCLPTKQRGHGGRDDMTPFNTFVDDREE